MSDNDPLKSVCGRTHLRSIAASAGSFVYGFGATISGYTSDNYGRKATIMVALILNISFHLASSFATSYPLYLALYWLAGNPNMGQYEISNAPKQKIC